MFTRRTAALLPNQCKLLKSFGASPRGRKLKAPITFTSAAADRIKDLIHDKPEAVGMKIGVKKRGCNGLSYTMNYATNNDLEAGKYELVEGFGTKVLVDPAAVFSIVGTEMNYEDTPLASEFTFKNPNSKGECGCGESFNM